MVQEYRSNIYIKAETYIWLSVALMIVPLPWVSAWVIAAVVHECAHLLMLYLLDVKVKQILVGAGGAIIRIDHIVWWKEALCAVAGPAGGAFLCVTAGLFPRLAVCGMIQTVFNILPLYPLDGGRILYCIANRVFGNHAAGGICAAVSAISIVILFVLCLHFRLGASAVVFLFVLAFRYIPVKFPCKQRRQIVQ